MDGKGGFHLVVFGLVWITSIGVIKGAVNLTRLLTLATLAAGARAIMTSIFEFSSGWVIMATQKMAVPIE